MMIDADRLRAQIKDADKYGVFDSLALKFIEFAIRDVEAEQRCKNRLAGWRRKNTQALNQIQRDVKSRSGAWGKGWKAGELGKPASACPYKHNAAYAESWHDAHARAYKIYHGESA